MSMQPMPVEVFCSYAHKDEAWLRKLEEHVTPLQQQGLISFWYDRLITPGTNWAQVIDSHLESASIILLLLSTDFFASDYCVGIEMKRALERLEGSEALVIPILLSEVNWRESPLIHLQALPTDAKPLTRWSDEEAALVNVAAGIRRAIEALPLLAASAPRAALPPVWNIPYPRNHFFLGRDTELAQVHHHLQAGQAVAFCQPQALSGLGGVGKSQVALEYAYRYHQDYQAVLWTRAESPEALVSSYLALATVLHLPEREGKEPEIIVAAVKHWLQTHRGWLLILDNADELALIPGFLPTPPGGHLLLTTRATATEGLARRLEIETFQPEQGALLLLRRAGLLAPNAELPQASTQERDVALQISQELGGLPLALDQAGAYLEATGIDIAEYWQLYQQHRTDLLAERKALIPDHPASVATTWSLSFDRVKEKNPAAADVLHVCAFLSPDAIPEEIFTVGASSLGPVLAPVAADLFLFHQAIEALRAYSLVRRDPKGKALSIHRLVQAVLQDKLEEKQRRLWVERAMLTVNAAFPDAEPDSWSQCESLLPHALLAAQYIEDYHLVCEEAGRILSRMSSYLQSRGRYIEAEPLSLQALRIREQLLGPLHLDMASSLHSLASLYVDLDKLAEAEPLYLQALAIREQLLRPLHPDVASSLNNLGVLYKELGQYAEAEPRYLHALRIWELQEGPLHPDMARPLNNLAELYRVQGRYAEAEPLYLQAVSILEQTRPEHYNLAAVLSNLAILYYDQGKFEEAEQFQQRALALTIQTYGEEHPDVATRLTNLGVLYCEQGKYLKVAQLFERALDIWEHQLGPQHRLVAIALSNLAEISTLLGKDTDAESFYQRALQIWAQHPEHSGGAEPLDGLANLYRKQGRYAEAEPLYQQALAIHKKAQERDRPKMAEVMQNLAQLKEAQNSHEEARIWYTHALTIRVQALGTHHPKTTETRTRLITLLHILGQHEDAVRHESDQAEP